MAEGAEEVLAAAERAEAGKIAWPFQNLKIEKESALKTGAKVTIIVLIIATLLAMSAVSGYNKVITMNENVKSQWAQVENQLKRRYDLIPNLVATVKGYAAHEKGVFDDIANARTKYFQANGVKDKIDASNQLEGALSRLLMLKEAYPQLKANENFLKLQDSLEGTENRIAVERMRYNVDARALNAYIKGIPGRFYAAMAGVSPAQYYEAPQQEQETPQVKF